MHYKPDHNPNPYRNLLYIGIQTLGILAILIAVLMGNTEIKALEAPKEQLWIVYTLWWITALAGYAASFFPELRSYLREFRPKYIPEIILVVGAISWSYSIWWTENAEIVYLTVCTGLLLWRRRFTLSDIGVVHWACIIYVLTTAIGALWSEYPERGAHFTEKQLMLILLPLSAGILSLSKEQVLRISWVILRLSLSVLVLQMLVYLYLVTVYSGGVLDGLTINKFYLKAFPHTTIYNILMPWAHMEHPSYHLLFFSAPWASIIALSSSLRKNLRLELGLYYLFLIIFTFITQARYGFWVIGLLPLLALSSYIKGIRSSTKLRYMLGVIVATILIGTIYYLYQHNVFSDGPRLEMFAYAIEHIKRYGIFGAGSGTDYTLIMERFGHPHSHNSFLSVALDTGIIGVVAMLALVCSTIYAAVKYHNRAILYWMLLLLPMMLIDSPFYVYQVIPPMALYFLLLGGNHLADSGKEAGKSPVVSPPIQ